MPVPEIDVDELAALKEKGAVVIDVRNPDEYESFRVPGAVLIPLGDVPERVEEVPTDETVYVICATGRAARGPSSTSTARASTPSTCGAAAARGSRRATRSSPAPG